MSKTAEKKRQARARLEARDRAEREEEVRERGSTHLTSETEPNRLGPRAQDEAEQVRPADSRAEQVRPARAGARVPVTKLLRQELEGGEDHAYSYRSLAKIVYGTSEPTEAQQVAIIRAVSKLVAKGQAMRHREHRGAPLTITGPFRFRPLK